MSKILINAFIGVRNRLALFTALSLLLVVSACVSSQVEQRRELPTASQLTANESVVILGRRQNFRHETEAEFTECVYGSLARRSNLNIKPESEFADQMFPWFSPRTAPGSADDLAKLLKDNAIAERLKKIGTRYVVWLDGVTKTGDQGGTMSCSIGPSGPACLGLVWWEKNAAYEAAIWDMDNFTDLGKITVDASGTSYVPAVIVPIPLVARTQAAACKGVAQQLTEFLTTGPSS